MFEEGQQDGKAVRGGAGRLKGRRPLSQAKLGRRGGQGNPKGNPLACSPRGTAWAIAAASAEGREVRASRQAVWPQRMSDVFPTVSERGARWGARRAIPWGASSQRRASAASATGAPTCSRRACIVIRGGNRPAAALLWSGLVRATQASLFSSIEPA